MHVRDWHTCIAIELPSVCTYRRVDFDGIQGKPLVLSRQLVISLRVGGASVFDELRFRYFLAKVQAELKAQHYDQQFVDLVCHLPSNLELLMLLRDQPNYRKDSLLPFLAVCSILGASLSIEDFSKDVKMTCAELLEQRLQKADSNLPFKSRHETLLIHLENRLTAWRIVNSML
jgi:hypothetical protein